MHRQTHHARLTADSGGLLDALQTFRWSGYSSHLSIASLPPGSFAVAILGFISRGVALHIANHSSRSITIHAGIISGWGEGNIFFL